MAASDFPLPSIIGYGSSPSRCGPARRAALVGRGISRFPRKERLHIPGSLTTPSCRSTRVDALGMSPSAITTASAPGIILTRLNGWPMHSPADASPLARPHQTKVDGLLASRLGMHGSGPMWIAIPSPCRTSTDCSLPASRRKIPMRPPRRHDHSTRRQNAPRRPTSSAYHRAHQVGSITHVSANLKFGAPTI